MSKTISLMSTKCGTDRNNLWLRAQHSLCNLCVWCCCCWLLRHFWRFPFQNGHLSHPITLNEIGCDIYLRVGFLKLQKDGSSRNRLSSASRKYVAEMCNGWNQLHHARHSRCNAFNWCWCSSYENSNCDVPWQGGGSVASGARWWWAPAECTSPSWIASRPMTALVAFWVSFDWECSPSCLLDHSLPLLRCPPIPASRLFAPCSWPPRSTFFSVVCSLQTKQKTKEKRKELRKNEIGRLLQHFLGNLRIHSSFFA